MLQAAKTDLFTLLVPNARKERLSKSAISLTNLSW